MLPDTETVIYNEYFYLSSSSAAVLDLRVLFFTSCLSHRVNVGCGPAEERVLLTGLHAVADIYCENCKTTLGWKYVSQLLLLKLSPETFYFFSFLFGAAVLLRNYLEVFLASKGTNYAITGQKNKVALIKTLLVKAMVTVYFAQVCI